MVGKGENYDKEHLAQSQWAVAGEQMQAFREGKPHRLFAAAGELLSQIDQLGQYIIRQNVPLLDVGCGCGYYSEIIDHYAPRRYSYVGVDFNLGMLQKARELYGGPYRRFYQQDARALTLFRDHSFPVVWSGACIAHIDQWQDAVREMCRASSRWLVLHRCPIWKDLRRKTTLGTRRYGSELVWIRRFKRSDLHAEVAAHGFFNVFSLTCGGALESYLYERQHND